MEPLIYYILCAVLSVAILFGISLMSKVKTAVAGNALSAVATLLAIILTLVYHDIISERTVLIMIIVFLLIGSIIGYWFTAKVKMIEMPQVVALFNGLGGAASAIVGSITIFTQNDNFELFTAIVAVIIGMVTLTGSLVAAGKLAGKINGRPIVLPKHQLINISLLILIFGLLVASFFLPKGTEMYTLYVVAFLVLSGIFGVVFTIRIGGADMPIAISLLNSFSGVAGSIAGMAISDVLLVSVGGIVGASGLLLTQIMCRAMNRSLMDILLGKTSVAGKTSKTTTQTVKVEAKPHFDLHDVLTSAKKVVIVPGYGMALAQAQHLVKQLASRFEQNGAEVKFAIHPVAGRMPGHMNVLLAEAEVDYDQLYELEAINPLFSETDLAIVVGANDVINPAAREAEGTPIYGMPILNVDQAKNIIICNYDLKPGYAGVDNPLYQSQNVHLKLGDAKDSLNELLAAFSTPKPIESNQESKIITDAKKVIIVPGYGMALAQAQHLIKQLADRFEQNGAIVKYAIHPVAGRMPGHMNVLLAEANVDYDQLFEMDQINDDFKNTDLVIVVGANDVINPAAREAEGTPIYGMPILNVDQAKHVIICNYDLRPGYAGVDNPLYQKQEGVTIKLGDAKDSLQALLAAFDAKNSESNDTTAILETKIKEAKSVIIVPGYGMALAQAQHLIKQLADRFEQNGAVVKYAIHPVAGRMPGHMNVLLAEANVDYDQLYEMENINHEFKDADLVIVVGANDVINPAAREAEGTPIYGMPILNVDQAKHVIICNYDLKPGYAGVDNPLYTKEQGVTLLLGDAKVSLEQLLSKF